MPNASRLIYLPLPPTSNRVVYGAAGGQRPAAGKWQPDTGWIGTPHDRQKPTNLTIEFKKIFEAVPKIVDCVQ
jgi:hypothetical protein